jgi:hypothetical protein
MNYKNKQTQEQTVTTTAEDTSNNGSLSSSASSSIVVPPQPPGRRPIIGHLGLINKIIKQSGRSEMLPALNDAFKMCAGENSTKTDIAHIDMVGSTFYLTSNADYAGIVTTDLEHWGKITHTDSRGGFYSARKVVGNALFTASDGADWGEFFIPSFFPQLRSEHKCTFLLLFFLLTFSLSFSNFVLIQLKAIAFLCLRLVPSHYLLLLTSH